MSVEALLITASGNWTVPAGVTLVKVARMVGGGAAGGSTSTGFGGGGGGGGASEFIENAAVNVTPGEVIPVTIGAAGVPYAVDTMPNDSPAPGSPQNGGETIFKHLRCQGGWGGTSNDIGLYATGTVSNGGGAQRGRYPISNPNGQGAVQGSTESRSTFGGPSGGSQTVGGVGNVGGYCNGYYGGTVTATTNSGGGGAASPFGPGGIGGAVDNPGPNNGGTPAAGAYGAAGGGCGRYGGGFTPSVGGTGLAGAVLLTWME